VLSKTAIRVLYVAGWFGWVNGLRGAVVRGVSSVFQWRVFDRI